MADFVTQKISGFRVPTLQIPDGKTQQTGLRPSINTQYTSRPLSQRLSTTLSPNFSITPPLTPQSAQDPLSANLSRDSRSANPSHSTGDQDSIPELESDSEPYRFHNYLRAFYHFHPTSTVSSVAEESSITLPINQGDVILVHSIQPNGWADGTLLNTGARGWLPTNYCEAYEHESMRNLLNALTYVWEFIRGHEEDESSVYAKQDYVRGMIAGVKTFLERIQCLNRDSPLVQDHAGLRKMRKGLLGDLSSFVKAAKLLQEVCHEQLSPDALYNLLDGIVLKAFKVVIRAVRFLDLWTQDVPSKSSHVVEKALPLTPPADNREQSAMITAQVDASILEQSIEPQAQQVSTGTNAKRQSIVHVPQPDPEATPVARTTPVPHRPMSVAQKRASASHRTSYSAAKPPCHKRVALASERLCTAHDAFLGYLGAFIGLHLQSRSSMELVYTTQESVDSCQSLIVVVDMVWERDHRRSHSLDQARDNMHSRLVELVQATREIFQPPDSADEAEMFMPDQGRRLMDAATLCVRSAGECVSKTRIVLERIGDFEFDPVQLGLVKDFQSELNQAPPVPEKDGLVQVHEIVDSHTPRAPSILMDAVEVPAPARQAPAPPTQCTHGPSCNSHDHSALSPSIPPVYTSRTSSETVIPPLGRSESIDSATGQQKFPSLDIDIPQSQIDFDEFPEPPKTSNPVTTKPTRADSVGVSIADSASTGLSSLRHSETSLVFEDSTRATTPEDVSDSEQAYTRMAASFGSISESQLTLVDDVEDAEAQLLAETYAHELVFNKEGQISGGSLPALVERLTTHDSTPDAMFVNTFYLTFRHFTTANEFARSLVARFDYAGDGQSFAGPVRLRVYNVFKGWLESHWSAETDSEALDVIVDFANGKLATALPSASRRILELTTKLSEARNGAIVPRLVSSMGKANAGISIPSASEGPLPNPVVSRSQLNQLRAWKAGTSVCSILDFDPLELARQFTIIESRIFCSIQPHELLACAWTKKDSKAVNVRAMSSLSTDLANLVADTILQFEEAKKRAIVIKQWIKIAKKCHELNNYDSLMAIICALTSTMVNRLKKTWDLVSPKTITRLEELKQIVDISRNFAVLRQRLQTRIPPCLPFVGMYLTDLTFTEAGITTTRQLPDDGSGKSVTVINFARHMQTAKIIGDLQRFQIPYRLTPVPEMQDWIEAQIRRMSISDLDNVISGYYRRSLALEPRETHQQAPSRPSPTTSASSSFTSFVNLNLNKDGNSTKEKFESWSSRHFPSTSRDRNSG